MSWVSEINKKYNNRDQWVQDEEGYKYKINGKYIKGWKEIDGNRYYFGSDEYMSTGWKVIEGNRYYFKTKEDAQKAGDKKAFGYMWTGWRNIDNDWYYFRTKQDASNKRDKDAYGDMWYGWRKIDGEWFYMKYDGKLVERSDLYTYDDSQKYYIDKYGMLVAQEDEASFSQRNKVLEDIKKEAVLRPDLYGNTDFISSQIAFDETLSTFGLSGNIDANGCGSIAMYNVLHGMGEDVSYKTVATDIVNESNELKYVYSGIKDNYPTNMDGTFGLAPSYIKEYLGRYGYKVEEKSIGEVSAEDYDLQSHAAYISMYFWFDKKNIKLGGHYEALIPNEEGGLDAYNMYDYYDDFIHYNKSKEEIEGSFSMKIYEIDKK